MSAHLPFTSLLCSVVDILLAKLAIDAFLLSLVTEALGRLRGVGPITTRNIDVKYKKLNNI